VCTCTRIRVCTDKHLLTSNVPVQEIQGRRTLHGEQSNLLIDADGVPRRASVVARVVGRDAAKHQLYMTTRRLTHRNAIHLPNSSHQQRHQANVAGTTTEELTQFRYALKITNN